MRPASIEEAQQAVAQLAGARKRLFIVGGGTQLGLGAPAQFDERLETGGLNRIVEYAPSDQVVTVEAGVTLTALQKELAGNGQRLSLDPPLPARATLGGIIAANSFGPLRTRFGSVRDLIIGVSIVRADGARAKGGGKVVKTVAGFDLPKLMCGSLGTLGLIVTATFRVHPIPVAHATLIAHGVRTADVFPLVRAIRTAQLEPAAMLAMRRARGSWDVAVRFEGFEAGVTQQREKLRALASVEPAEWPQEAASGALRLKVAALPTELEKVEAALPFAQSLSWLPTLGIGFAGAAAPNAADTAGAVDAARRSIQVVVEAAPFPLDPWGAPTAALRLHRAVKERFDPDNLLAPGRFVGGI